MPDQPTLSKGCVVHCRSHHHLVEDVQPPEDGGDTVVRLACLDDDAKGQVTEVFWEREVDARVLGQSTWETIGQRHPDLLAFVTQHLQSAPTPAPAAVPAAASHCCCCCSISSAW